MTKELLISSSPHETKVAVLEDDQLVEVYFQRDTDVGLVGGIYKGRVNRVLPGMQSAFVDIGLERDAFLYVSDFFEDVEEYDRVFTEAENRVAKLTAAGGMDAAPMPLELLNAESRVEASVAQGSQPAPAEPRSFGVTEAASLPPAGTSPPENTPPSAGPPIMSPATPESKQHALSGDRPRRRGRRFREFRHGNRRESGRRPDEHREQGPPHGLELLPGESLARYGHNAAETSPPADAHVPEHAGQTPLDAPAAAGAELLTEDISSGPPSGARSEEPLRNLAQPEPNTREERERPGPSSFEDFGPLSTSPNNPPGESVWRAESEETAKRQPRREGDWGRSDSSEEAGDFEDDLDANFGAGDAGRTQQSPSPAGTASSTDLFRGANTGGPLSPDIPPNQRESTSSESVAGEAPGVAPGQQSETEAPPGPAGIPAGQSYTLREPSHQAHVAPRRGRRGRGRFRGHPGRGIEGGGGRAPELPRTGNHQPLAISELLKEGQEILVQIAKEPLGAKGARITSHIALPGRYLVYMPTINHIGVSRKIGSEEERLRLRNIIVENRGSLGGGFIVRTAGAGRSEEELKADLAFLTNLWNEIRGKAERTKAPALLHRDLTLVERVLRDLLSPEFKCVRVDNEIEYEHILDFVNRFQPSLVGHIKLYTRDAPLFEEFGVQGEIDRALKPKVWLKSGGYIVINQTEALVAIDVNTGKYVGKTSRLEDTIVKTNIDAVKEIVRQIRLRDLGGIIVIDFIDMDERRNRAKVVQALDDALRHDRAPTKILSFNEFGLVALTRKRVKHSLERALCEPCPYCASSGWIKSVATVSYDILSEARKMASQIEGNTLHLRVNPDVASRLKARGGALVSEIESLTRKDVVIKADPNVHQEQFEIY